MRSEREGGMGSGERWGELMTWSMVGTVTTKLSGRALAERTACTWSKQAMSERESNGGLHSKEPEAGTKSRKLPWEPKARSVSAKAEQKEGKWRLSGDA